MIAGDHQTTPNGGSGVTTLLALASTPPGRVGASGRNEPSLEAGPAVGQPNSQGRCLMPLMKLDSR
jgi:hypothetical protein